MANWTGAQITDHLWSGPKVSYPEPNYVGKPDAKCWLCNESVERPSNTEQTVYQSKVGFIHVKCHLETVTTSALTSMLLSASAS